MKVEEIRALSTKELTKRLETAHQELFDLRFRLSTKQLVNHCQVRVAKKEIAKLKTIMREKALSIR